VERCIDVASRGFGAMRVPANLCSATIDPVVTFAQGGQLHAAQIGESGVFPGVKWQGSG
jgi:hypothetical protein